MNAKFISEGFSGLNVINDFMGNSAFDLYVSGSSFFVYSRDEGEIIAFIGNVPYCRPDFRGRGIMSAAYVIQDERDQRISSSSYTESGLMSRVRTHRLHVQGAVDRGEDIPDIVMRDYAITDGEVRLRTPFDMDAYRTMTLDRRDVKWRRVMDEDDENLLFCSRRYITHEGEEKIKNYHGQTDDAISLVLGIQERHGGMIRVTTYEGWNLHQVQIDDLIIDAYGARKEGSFKRELKQRHHIPRPDEVVVSLFNDTEEYLAHIKKFPNVSYFFSEREKDNSVRPEEMLDRITMGLSGIGVTLLQEPSHHELSM